jgi:hypothetical protein
MTNLMTFQKAADARVNAEREFERLENALSQMKNRLGAGDSRITTEDLAGATFAVQRAELLLANAVEVEKTAKAVAEKSDDLLAEFTRDVFAVNAHRFGLHDAQIVVSKGQPAKDEVAGKTLVISQHSATEIHGNGQVSGRVTAVGYGGVLIDRNAFQGVFGEYGMVQFGNFPTYDFRYTRILTPDPIITQPSAEPLAATFARKAGDMAYTFDGNGKWVSRAHIDINSAVDADSLKATAIGETISAEGSVHVWVNEKWKGYGVNDITAYMKRVIEAQQPGTFVPGVGVIESCEFVDARPVPAAPANGVRVQVDFKAAGKRRVMA